MTDKTKMGGPARPTHAGNFGMSLRDHYAGEALSAIIAARHPGNVVVVTTAMIAIWCDEAFEVAEQMIIARGAAE